MTERDWSLLAEQMVCCVIGTLTMFIGVCWLFTKKNRRIFDDF